VSIRRKHVPPLVIDPRLPIRPRPNVSTPPPRLFPFLIQTLWLGLRTLWWLLHLNLVLLAWVFCAPRTCAIYLGKSPGARPDREALQAAVASLLLHTFVTSFLLGTTLLLALSQLPWKFTSSTDPPAASMSALLVDWSNPLFLLFLAIVVIGGMFAWAGVSRQSEYLPILGVAPLVTTPVALGVVASLFLLRLRAHTQGLDLIIFPLLGVVLVLTGFMPFLLSYQAIRRPPLGIRLSRLWREDLGSQGRAAILSGLLIVVLLSVMARSVMARPVQAQPDPSGAPPLLQNRTALFLLGLLVVLVLLGVIGLLLTQFVLVMPGADFPDAPRLLLRPKARSLFGKWFRIDRERTLGNLETLICHTGHLALAVDICHDGFPKTARKDLVKDLFSMGRWSCLSEGDWRFLMARLAVPPSFAQRWLPWLQRSSGRRFAKELEKRFKAEERPHPYQKVALALFQMSQGNPEKAADHLRAISDSDEIREMARLLYELAKASDLARCAELRYRRPAKPLYAEEWSAIDRFLSSARRYWLLRHTLEPDRALLLDGEWKVGDPLEAILEPLKGMETHGFHPSVRGPIRELAETWRVRLQRASEREENFPAYQRCKRQRNPFTPHQPLPPNHYVIHQEQLKEVERAWTAGATIQSVLIEGEPGTGKSSFFLKAIAQVEDKAAFVVVDLSQLHANNPSEQTACRFIMEAICAQDPALQQACTGLWSANLDRLAALIWALGERAHHRQRPTVLVLDHYHRLCDLISSGALRADFLDVLAHSVAQTPNVGITYIGTPWETIPLGVLHPAAESMVRVHTGILSPQDLMAYLDTLPPDLLMTFTESAREAFYKKTAGNPVRIQHLGHSLVEEFNHQLDTGQDVRPYFTKKDVCSTAKRIFPDEIPAPWRR